MDKTEQKNIIEALQKLEISECFENNIPLRGHIQNIYVLNSLLGNIDVQLREAAELYFSYGIDEANKIILDRKHLKFEQISDAKQQIIYYTDKMREIGYYEKYIEYIKKRLEGEINQDTYNFIIGV